MERNETLGLHLDLDLDLDQWERMKMGKKTTTTNFIGASASILSPAIVLQCDAGQGAIIFSLNQFDLTPDMF